jgi:hypothetical protein
MNCLLAFKSLNQFLFPYMNGDSHKLGTQNGTFLSLTAFHRSCVMKLYISGRQPFKGGFTHTMPFPCRSPAVPMLFPCRSPTMPFC